MVGPDPLATVWQALDAGGYDPHGPEYDFRSRCPGHDGDNRDALHVSEGADRRAVVHCFVGCDPEQIVQALGLEWRDLFPAGHRHHRRRARATTTEPRRRGPLEIVLEGLEQADIPVRGMWIADRCPYCDAPALWLRPLPDGAVDAACADGCSRDEILGALETIVAIREARNGER